MAITERPPGSWAPQEMFDHVVDHLLDQGTTSESDFAKGCAYRGDNGTACAAGCLIPDSVYSPSMERRSVCDPGPGDTEPLILMFPMNCRNLLEDLQSVHDDTAVENWESDLRMLAARHGLEWNSGTGNA